MKLNTWLINGSILTLGIMLTACVDMPGSKSDQAKVLALPKRYDATQPPVPEVTSGLLKVFPDTQLRKYVDIALNKNPDLRASAARLEESGFNTRRAYSATLPSLTANGSGSRSRIAGSPNSIVSPINNIFSTSLDVAWEVDVWGRIRAGVTASASDEAAAAADYAAARQSIAAQTMQAYFTLIAEGKLLALSNRRLSSFQKTHDLVNRRFEAGVDSLGDVDLARTDVERTKAEVQQRKDTRDQAARQLRVITGRYPTGNARAYAWPSLRRSVPAGVPSTVLMNRPDIDAAYQRIRAADAGVKVAHRDLYPRFNLTGSGGRQSSVFEDLLESDFRTWSLAAGITAPILDGGNRRAELGAANARAKEALANYESVVLSAMQEVENALGSEYYLKQQEISYKEALKAAKSAEESVLRSYEQGTVEILSLLESQRRAFDTEEQLINVRAQRYQNRVSLALALGKGL